MSEDPQNIPIKVTHRVCPNCGYVVSQLEVQVSVIDYICPKCEVKRFSEFEPRCWD